MSIETHKDVKRGVFEVRDVQEDKDYHVDGTEVIGDCLDAAKEFFQGQVHAVIGSSYYHDYFTLHLARVFPSEGDCYGLAAAVRKVLPEWHNVSVTAHRESNRLIITAYAHNIIQTSVPRYDKRILKKGEQP